jgi:hypothetical protein
MIIVAAASGVFYSKKIESNAAVAKSTGDIKPLLSSAALRLFVDWSNILLLLALVYFSIALPPVFLVVTVPLFGIGILIRKHPIFQRYPRISSSFVFSAIMFFSFLVIIGSALGIVGAYNDLGEDAPLYQLASSKLESEVVVLRFVDKGVLVWIRPETKIAFVPWDDVKLIASTRILANRSLWFLITGRNPPF